MRVGCNLNEKFSVKVLFITVLKAFSQEFQTGCPWGNLYADDALSSSLNRWRSCKRSGSSGTPAWKERDFGATWAKPRSSQLGLDSIVFKIPTKDPFAMFFSGISTNSIICEGCSSWLNKRCSSISGTLKPNPTFRCKRCTGLARPVDSRPMIEVTMGMESLR